MTIVQGHLDLAVVKYSPHKSIKEHHQHKVLLCCGHKWGDHLYTSGTIKELELFLVVLPKVQGLHDFSYCLLQRTENYCLKKPEAMIILVHVSHSEKVCGINGHMGLYQMLC